MTKKIAFIFDIPKNEKKDERMLQQWVHPSINYDILYLTDNPSLKKVLVKDITLDIKGLISKYLFIVPIGAEPFKKVIKHKGGITKYHAQLLTDPMPSIPIKSPNIVYLNPAEEPAVKHSFDVIKQAWDNGSTEEAEIVTDYKFIDNSESAIRLFRDLASEKAISFDTETTDLDPYVGDIIGCTISSKLNNGWFIPFKIMKKCRNELAELLKSVTVIMHNAKFDKKWMFHKLGIEIPNFHCTMIMHYLFVDQTKGTHSLKLLAMKYTNLGDYSKAQDDYITKFCRQAKIKKADFTFDMIPLEILVPYACSDSDATLQLMHNMGRPAFKDADPITRKCYLEIMLPAVDSLMHMELSGAPIDNEYLTELAELYQEEIADIKKEMYKFDAIHRLEHEQKQEFNPNSYQQIGKLLYDKLGLPTQGKTATGNNTTDATALNALAKLHDMPKLILQLRAATKMYGTYVSNIILGIKANGRMRGNFNLTVAESGRLSSSEEKE